MSPISNLHLYERYFVVLKKIKYTFRRGTHKVSVAHPDEAIPEVHGLVLQDVDSDLLILGLATCEDMSLS